MITRTVNKWIKTLITENNVDQLSDIKNEILDNEIQNARAIINNPDINISSVLKQCYLIYTKYLEYTKNNKEIEMVKEIVKGWVDELCETNKVKELKEVSKEILSNELEEAKGTISNCRIMEDSFGIICNEYYIRLLQEALGKEEREITIKICDNKYEIIENYNVYNGYFIDKPKEQSAQIMVALANYLGYKPSELLNFDDDTFDLED